MAAKRNWSFSLPLRIGMQHVPLCIVYVINVNYIYIDNMLEYIRTEEPHFLVHDDERRV
jgi:hypothetical protein